MTPHHPVVAIIAEESSDFTCSMIMVNRQPNWERRLVLTAYAARMALFFKELFILFLCYPILATEVSRPITFPHYGNNHQSLGLDH
jgi:hypothetical protein